MSATAEPASYPVTPYPPVDPSPSFPKLEERIVARWHAENTFQRSVEQRPAGVDGANEYVFYDGPPFANGLPHYGHLLTSYVKDVIPRYRTMRGRRVERRFGWDTHGMPAEVHAENELGVSGHNEIKAYGIDRFNDACRTSVLRYTHEWEAYMNRAARWVDFANDYKTLDLPYMESVMWAFKTLHDKGLIYEGYKVMPYCWRCETPLSNTELKMDDVYKNRQDPAVRSSTKTATTPAKCSSPGPLPPGRSRRTLPAPLGRRSNTRRCTMLPMGRSTSLQRVGSRHTRKNWVARKQ